MANLDDPKPLTHLPLCDPENPWLPGAARGPGLARDPECRRCNLWQTANTVCLPTVGEEGPLIVMPPPTNKDDAIGRFVADSGLNAIVGRVVQKYAPAGARYTWAIRCAAGRDPEEQQIEACRPFLAHELAARPPRVIVLGPQAAEATFGQPFWADRTRRAWTELDGLPCYLVMHPERAARNKFFRGWFESDLAWALTAPAQQAPQGEVEVAYRPERAVELMRALRPGEPIVFDCEHHPKQWWAQGAFRLLCLGICQDPTAPFVLPEQVVQVPEVRREIKRVFGSLLYPKVGHSAKHDRHVLWRALEVETVGIEWDTLVVAGLMESEGPKGLEPLSWTVGMGGYKQVGQMGADDEE